MLCCIRRLLTSTSPAWLFSNWSVTLDTFCWELLPHFNRSWWKRQQGFSQRSCARLVSRHGGVRQLLGAVRAQRFVVQGEEDGEISSHRSRRQPFVCGQQTGQWAVSAGGGGTPHGWMLKWNFTKQLYLKRAFFFGTCCSTWLFQYNVHNMPELHHEWSKSFSHIYRNM